MIKCPWCGTQLKIHAYSNRLHCDHCNRMVTKDGDKVYDTRK